MDLTTTRKRWQSILFCACALRFLYDIFVNPSFVSHPCPLLLAVNKSDLNGCEDNQAVFDRIENELYPCKICFSVGI